MIPGVILAVICFGWALQIYAKPIPKVAQEAITATAAGQVALEEGRPEDAVENFSVAVEAQEDYSVAHRGLGAAILLTGNPNPLDDLGHHRPFPRDRWLGESRSWTGL